MAMKWTNEQQKVISLRNRNILVSAGAGSGKTAVLVQRILSKIMDQQNPVDIDRLLIMTFTRAAAGEMRERIQAALEQALYDNPDDEHLQRQMTLIHAAQITTIDGFCSYIIRNYFHLIDLDPGYRTADEGELKLLKEDVLREILEESYASGDKAFINFVECYAPGKTDDELHGMLLKLYEAAMSHPNPEEWLNSCLEIYRTAEPEEAENRAWQQLLWENAEFQLTEALSLVKEANTICRDVDGPSQYAEAVAADRALLEDLKKRAEEKDYDGLVMKLGNISFVRLSAKKNPDCAEEKKDKVKEIREQYKEIVKELGERYFFLDAENLQKSMEQCRQPLEKFVELVHLFARRFSEKKREKNLLDFTDMEHFALKILIYQEENGEMMSQAARELSEKYDEVLVDEYQDSNLVQELLTNCVSGWINQRKNIFMVGDVKQSIYRFRLARPDLFMAKYESYTLEDSLEQRIDLHKNFRSRKEVLDCVNYIFRRIMGADLGGITYVEAEELHAGMEYPEGVSKEEVKTEVILIEKDRESLTDEESKEEAVFSSETEQQLQNEQEMEALAIIQRIRRLVGVHPVWDKEKGEYRPAEYGDIAVLLRSASGWAETFLKIFSSKGIPAYTASKTGYFSALEIITVLNYLRICDNPLQDIPMTGVLRSPIVGCTAKELAIVKCINPEGYFYEGLRHLTEQTQDEVPKLLAGEIDMEQYLLLKEKLTGFLKTLNEIREAAAYTPIHQLIQKILKDTGYGDYAKAMPGGMQRSANLAMLVEKAVDYEKTSYRGLFNFVRYIERMQKYEVDFGEVNLSAGEGTSVQIMTIHKSKGLEFPIVFVAGMGKQFNFQDINARILVHPDLGIGTDVILPEKRQVIPGMIKQLIRRELLKESLGEELRVLYVALTRAREKLFITGIIGNLEKKLREALSLRGRSQELIPVWVRMRARNFWDYLLAALADHPAMEQVYEEFNLEYWHQRSVEDDPAEFVIHRITAQDLTIQEVLNQSEDRVREQQIAEWDREKIYDPKIREILSERFSYAYPYEYLKEIPVKVSVSELKKRSWHGDDEREESLFFEPEITEQVPAFIAKKDEEYKGAARGTAYHKLMEYLDYTRVASKEEIIAQLQEMVVQQKIQQAERECISVRDIKTFADSDLGKRIGAAAADKCLYREQPFVMSVNANELNEEWENKEKVLVQGIIDAYFIEDGEIVLVDYKTDRVRRGQEQKLVDLYHTQLEDYAKALERMLGMRVKEAYIYSFTLHKAIEITLSSQPDIYS